MIFTAHVILTAGMISLLSLSLLSFSLFLLALVYDLKRTVVNQSKFPQYKISTKKLKVFFVLRHAAVGLDLLTFSLYCVPFSSAKHLFFIQARNPIDPSLFLLWLSFSIFPDCIVYGSALSLSLLFLIGY